MTLTGTPLLPLAFQGVPLRVLQPWEEPLSSLCLGDRGRVGSSFGRLGLSRLNRRGLGRRAGRQAARRWRRVLHRVGDFFSYLASGLLKFLDARAKTLRQLRQLFRANQDEHDRENQNGFPAT